MEDGCKRIASGNLEFDSLLSVDVTALFENVDDAYYYQLWEERIEDIYLGRRLRNRPNQDQSVMTVWYCMEIFVVPIPQRARL